MPVAMEPTKKSAIIQNFFAVAVENPAVFHAFMAKTRCDFDAYVGQREAQIPSSQVLYHRGKALKSLSKEFTNSTVGYESVTAVTLLSTIDVGQIPED